MKLNNPTTGSRKSTTLIYAKCKSLYILLVSENMEKFIIFNMIFNIIFLVTIIIAIKNEIKQQFYLNWIKHGHYIYQFCLYCPIILDVRFVKIVGQ